MHFISCLSSVVRTSNTMLNRSIENEHLCLVPDFRGKAFNISPLSMMLVVGLSWVTFIILRYVPSITTLMRVLLMSDYWILSNASSVPVEMVMWLISFLSLMCYITLIDLQILSHHCISKINPTWSWCMVFYVYCWILFTNILLRIFASMFISYIGL